MSGAHESGQRRMDAIHDAAYEVVVLTSLMEAVGSLDVSPSADVDAMISIVEGFGTVGKIIREKVQTIKIHAHAIYDGTKDGTS